MTEKNIISVEHLVRKYGKFTAVDDISFQVGAGEIFGFLGPNGAGKSTTISILCTLLKPSSGKATVNGFDVARQQHQVRQSIGLVFQDPSLDDQLTAQENLHFHAMVYNIPGSVRKKRIDEALKMVELDTRRNDIVKNFSGGMKRRLEIARGLLHYPKVLFLDEPTLGLDPQTRNRIWEFLLDLRTRENVTIFLTTHYMDEAEHANRIAIIDKGKIIALDTPDKLKDMVGGDIINLKTVDDKKAADEISQRYRMQATDGHGELLLEVANGDEFIPTLVRDLNTRIISISLRRPTLEDVFLKLTGRAIRDSEVSSMEAIKSHMRFHGRR
ncbi:MAG: ATP-binding cassette domain-containing protein [Dehalococcoidia bacterium]|nr:ATP-binding cassette domain-containing protein [Dehalococcoidia bacterium]